uniref:Uncharacterized protein n=1 Tax=Oryza glaberrima TaxID=4538 RepID=I1P594_ORYGL
MWAPHVIISLSSSSPLPLLSLSLPFGWLGRRRSTGWSGGGWRPERRKLKRRRRWERRRMALALQTDCFTSDLSQLIADVMSGSMVALAPNQLDRLDVGRVVSLSHTSDARILLLQSAERPERRILLSRTAGGGGGSRKLVPR